MSELHKVKTTRIVEGSNPEASSIAKFTKYENIFELYEMIRDAANINMIAERCVRENYTVEVSWDFLSVKYVFKRENSAPIRLFKQITYTMEIV